MRVRQLIRVQVLFWVVGPWTASAAAQVDQTALARQLLHGDRTEQIVATDRAGGIEPGDVTPALRTALITALEREGRLKEQLARKVSRGDIEYLQTPMLGAKLAMLVIPLDDANAIPGLVWVMNQSGLALFAVADFGEPAVRLVLDAIATTASTSLVQAGMMCLRLMIEGAGDRPLSTETLAAIRRVAEERLTEPQRFVTTLWTAIDLATALDDPDLRRIVQSLATNPEAVKARGVEDPRDIKKTQERAADGLAGILRPIVRPQLR
jgi:hypothetical protein